MDLEDVRHRLLTLMHRLERITDKFPEQDVRGIALPVIDALANEGLRFISDDDPVGAAVRGLLSPEAVAENGGAIRAVDAVVVVEQLRNALPPAPAPAPIPGAKYEVDWMNKDF